MRWVYDDGGRKAAGRKGEARDCVVRAVAIAAELPYREVYDALNECAKAERPKPGRKRSSARLGVSKRTLKRFMRQLGWVWTPTMRVGSGCRIHLRDDELPKGRLVASLSRHVVAVIDGVIHDTHDPHRDGYRCVYGFWEKG